MQAFLQRDGEGSAPEVPSAKGGARRIDSEWSVAGMPPNASQLSDLGWPSEEEAALALSQAPDKVTIVTETPPWLDCLVSSYRCVFCQPR